MRYTLRQLEVFLAVARTGSLTAASNELSMSQSAASGSLKEFETRFDTQLFDRVGKRLKINPAGRALLTKAEELLQRASDLEVTLSSKGGFGSITVGATMTIGNYLFVDMFRVNSFHYIFYKKSNPRYFISCFYKFVVGSQSGFFVYLIQTNINYLLF